MQGYTTLYRAIRFCFGFVILFWVLCSCFLPIGHSIEHITKGVQTKIFAFSRYNLVSVTTDIKDSGLLVRIGRNVMYGEL